MNKLLALSLALGLSTTAVFAEDTKPAITPSVIKYRQNVLEPLRHQLYKTIMIDNLAGYVLTDKDMDAFTANTSEADVDKYAEGATAATDAISKLIISLGGTDGTSDAEIEQLETEASTVLLLLNPDLK